MRTMVKRIFSIGVCGLIILTPITSNAWGGYTHWEISDRVASNNGMRSTVANYYKSGALMADIGKSTWDDDYTISDSRSFAREMLQIARKSKFSSHVNFASGWYDHYLQDSKGSVANITGGPSSYRVKCGWIDEYLRDYEDIRSPIDGTAPAYVVYSLIRDTYDSLDGYTPSDSLIDRNIGRMYSLYDAQILLNISGWTASERRSIEKELDRTADLCSGIQSMTRSANILKIENVKDEYLDIDEITSIVRKNDHLRAAVDEINELTTLEKEIVEDGVYKVTYVILDQEAYDQKVQELADKIRLEY